MNAALVVRHHVVTPGEPDELLQMLLQSCHDLVDVCPLSSGRICSVSGQVFILSHVRPADTCADLGMVHKVALHCGPATVESAHALISRSGAVLYRLTDSGGMFFDRGTGSGVL